MRHYAVTVGIPSGRIFALSLAFGIYTRRTGEGRCEPMLACTCTAISARAWLVSATSPSIPAVLRPVLRCVTCRTLHSVLAQLRSISFWTFLAVGQSPSCTALKIRPRSRRTCSSWCRQFTRSQASPSNEDRPSGPFTEVSNLPISSGIYPRFASKAHLPTSAPLRAGHTVPYPASYAGRPAEEPTIASRFPVPFQAPAFASWAPCPTGEFRFLYSRPTRTRDAPWTPAGVYTFRTRETRPGWVPSVSRGRGVPPSRATSPAGHVRFSAASPAPRQSFHLRGSKSRDISQGFNRSPVRPSSRPWSPGGAGTLRLSPELSTLPLPATHLGAKTGHTDTDPGLYHRHNRTSFVQPTQLVRPRVAMPPFSCPASASWAPQSRQGLPPPLLSAYRTTCAYPHLRCGP
jgi:hypothetical protein